jgi:hypothetical protein
MRCFVLTMAPPRENCRGELAAAFAQSGSVLAPFVTLLVYVFCGCAECRWAGRRTTFRLINNYWTQKYTRGDLPIGASQQRLVLFAFNALKSVSQLRMKYGRRLGQILYLAPEVAVESKAAYEATQEALSKKRLLRVRGKNAAPSVRAHAHCSLDAIIICAACLPCAECVGTPHTGH